LPAAVDPGAWVPSQNEWSDTMTLFKSRPVQVASFAMLAAGSAHAQRPKNRIAAPTNITITSTIAALTMDCSPVSGAVSYMVNYRRAGSTIVTQPGQVAAPHFEMRPPVPGMTFEYQVVAVAMKQQAPASLPLARLLDSLPIRYE
jgi:hypothetical protein